MPNAFAQWSFEERAAVQGQAVEDEVALDGRAVFFGVKDQLAIEEGVGVVGVWALAREGEVEVRILDKVVVVLAVDEEIGFYFRAVYDEVCEEEEAADAICLFAEVVAGVTSQSW